LLVVFGVARSGRTSVVPFTVAGYVAAAYWFTSSTSFANPAATIGRTVTDTFAGIAPRSAVGFVVAELAGTVLAVVTIAVLFPRVRQAAADVVVPHADVEGIGSNAGRQ
jgi:arsenate reductase